MRILPLTTISFKAGKVHFYTDFDGTFLPIKQGDIKRDLDVQKLRDYADKMDKFFKSTQSDLDFHITTGRHYDSYKKACDLFKSKNIKLPLPKSFVTENGYMVFEQVGNPERFYENADFPYNKTNFHKRPHGEEKSKAYNILKILKETKSNNDLIIVAGNAGNDKEMLNPLKYIDLKKYELKTDNPEFFKKDMNGKLIDLKNLYHNENSEYINSLRNEFKNNGLLKEIEDLPIRFVIVKKSENRVSHELQNLLETFGSTGKFLEIEKGNMDNALKESIKEYASKITKFKDGMSDKFKDVILGKNRFNKNKMLFFLLGIITLGFGIALYLKKDNNLESSKSL